jgi:hypothetical protein
MGTIEVENTVLNGSLEIALMLLAPGWCEEGRKRRAKQVWALETAKVKAKNEMRKAWNIVETI